MKLNRTWHSENKMPENSTVEGRIKWYFEHLKNCQCRKGIPEKLKAEMMRRKQKND